MSDPPRRTPGDAIGRAQRDGSPESHSAGVCAYCERWADPAIIIAMVHANSGPGWTRYAHPTCSARRPAP
ncbi:MAG: hypothetical protein ACRDPK_11500 [Carbonactinosporaceae bacterium]